MEDKQIKLNDLRKNNPQVPIVKADSLYDKADKYDSVINNSFVEDQIMRNPENLLNGTINQKISRLNSLKSKDSVLASQLNNVDQIIAREEEGYGTTGIGRRALEINRARKLGSEKAINLASIEELRGNVESSIELQRQAQTLAAKNKSELAEVQGLTDKDIVFREVLAKKLNSGEINEAQYTKLKKAGFFAIEKNSDNYGTAKSNPQLDEMFDYVTARTGNINLARTQGGSAFADPSFADDILNQYGSSNVLNNQYDYIPKPDKDDSEEGEITDEEFLAGIATQFGSVVEDSGSNKKSKDELTNS